MKYCTHQAIRRYRRGFTLIELLVVIAIIGILAAILFPVFARARENARRASCQSNLKQIGLGVMQYTQDHDERMPYQQYGAIPTFAAGEGFAIKNYFAAIYPYTKSWQILRCPSARPFTDSAAPVGDSDASYFVNGVVITNPATASSRNIASIPEPANVIQASEYNLRSHYTFLAPTYSPDNIEAPATISAGIEFQYWNHDANYNSLHFEGANLLYCDGHVKWRKRSSICTGDFGLGAPSAGPACGLNSTGATASALF